VSIIRDIASMEK